jgi:ketosteroid isomerase-like protein
VNETSEEKIVTVARERIEASGKRDVEKMLSLLTEDVVWTNNEGTFNGKDEVKRYFTWETQRIKNAKTRAAGIGTIVKGNIVVHELVFEGSTSDGRRFSEIPVIIVEEFSGEKIQRHREYFDRLSMTKQAAKGWFEKMIVGAIVNRTEKGLH